MRNQRTPSRQPSILEQAASNTVNKMKPEQTYTKRNAQASRQEEPKNNGENRKKKKKKTSQFSDNTAQKGLDNSHPHPNQTVQRRGVSRDKKDPKKSNRQTVPFSTFFFSRTQRRFAPWRSRRQHLSLPTNPREHVSPVSAGVHQWHRVSVPP